MYVGNFTCMIYLENMFDGKGLMLLIVATALSRVKLSSGQSTD